MFFVYILQSKKDKELYIGYTNNLRKRFKKHNLGLMLNQQNIEYRLKLSTMTLNYEMPRAKALFRSFSSILATNLLSFVGLSYG